MRAKIQIKEILYLSIFFTLLALYFDIHKEHNVLTFIIDHVVALLIALIISKVIYYFITNRK
jgi:Kef-type K+ transport system membrane component KefB